MTENKYLTVVEVIDLMSKCLPENQLTRFHDKMSLFEFRNYFLRVKDEEPWDKDTATSSLES